MDSNTVFYGMFLAEIQKDVVKNHSYCKTACVVREKDDLTVKMLFAEEFIDTLKDEEKKYLVLHETLHICFEHIFGVHNHLPKKQLINAAEDLEINGILGKNNMPSGGLHPTLYEFPLDLGTLEYYKLLDEAQETRSQKDSNGNPSSTGNEKLDELIDSLEEMDFGHALWDSISKLSDSQKEILKRDVLSKLERSLKECNEKQIGNIPARLRDKFSYLFEIQPPVIDWKQAFKSFVHGSIKSYRERTYRKENHRFPDSMGSKTQYLPKILVAVDQSGSMSNYDLEEVYSQLFHMYKTGVSIDCLPWDGNVGDLYEYRGEPMIQRQLSGGTNPNCVLKWLQDKYSKYSCVIICTDGYIPDVYINSRIPLLWVITSDGNSAFDTKYKKVKISKTK